MNRLSPQPNSSDCIPRRSPDRDPLAQDVIESVAAWLSVIAEPHRIRLIEILNGGGATAQGLAAKLNTTRQNVCRHLGVLHQAGIVSRRRVGNQVEYELIDWSGWWLIEQVGGSVATVLAERRTTS